MPEKVILCVDDEEIILEVLKEQLKRRLGNEYLIEVAQGGEEALALVEELSAEGFEIQMIIADQIMPGMKGDELLTAVHQKYPDTLKVFLTGRADAQAVGNAVNQANLYRYLAKPWDEEDLYLTVEEGLRSYEQDKQLAAQNEALQRQQEENRLLREELAHVLRIATMGELTAALAHEINQPLTAIRSNAQAAKRFMNTDTPDLDEIGEILDDIIADDRRAAEVIIRLRALLQKQTITTAPLDINAVVGEVTGLLHSDAVIKNVAVELDLAEDLPPVLGDRVQLQQVLLNLMMNGFDAMEGVPTPERILVIRTAQEAGSLVRVSVRDAGVGFDGQDVEELFAPFKTTKAKGLGMGLAISRSIIEAHGGKIWAEDNADRGATFHFTLPVEVSA
ncbi:MAG: response regulator [Bacteroidetes bacterium]|nr:response regulator [Bacteroidota bacterium]